MSKVHEQNMRERWQAFNELAQLAPERFGYIKLLPNMTENRKYSTHFIKEVIMEIKYGNIDDPNLENELKRTLIEFIHEYNIHLSHYWAAELERQKQLEMYMYQLQQQQAQTNAISFQPQKDGQVDYSDQNNYSQYQQNQAYQQQAYGHQQQPYYGQNQQQINQNYQNQGYPNQGQGYQNQGQGYNQGYPNQRHHNNYNNQQRQNNRNNQGQYYQNNRDRNQQQNGQSNQPHQDKNQNQYSGIPPFQGKKEKYSEKIAPVAPKEPEVQLPPPPPPKPVPKPMKFSIEQIKDLINNKIYEDDIKTHASAEIIAKVAEISAWESKIQSVELTLNKKDSNYTNKNKDRNDRNNNNNNNANNSFNKGGNYRPNQQEEERAAQAMGIKMDKNKPKDLQIVIGKNQTLETKEIKNQIKSKIGQDFASQMAKQEVNLNQLQKAKKEIVFNLNLLAPENLKKIEEDLIEFLYEDREVLKILIHQILEKAWEQPKYASTYANLCLDFSKKISTNFKFTAKEGEKEKDQKKKETNPFKFFLVEEVQHSFDKKTEDLKEFKDDIQKEAMFKDIKKKIMGNIKFIAELILSKVLKKSVMKYCISQLLYTFLTNYYAYKKNKELKNSTYDYYYEAVIEFIENVGERIETIDEQKNEKKKQNDSSVYNEAQKWVTDIISLTKEPPQEIQVFEKLSCQQYFDLIIFINDKILKETNPRLGALLLNLLERREKKWQKHLSAADGPMRLKDIKKQEDETEKIHSVAETNKAFFEKLDKKVKELFESWELEKKSEARDIKDIFKHKFTNQEFYYSFLKQVADGKKEVVAKRVELFAVVFNEFYRKDEFTRAWLKAIQDMAYSSSDFPFCGAAYAKILFMIVGAEGEVANYFKKFNDEDQEFFMEEVFQKFYIYSKNEKVKAHVPVKEKLSGLI